MTELVSDRIRRLRRARGLSGKALAARLGVTGPCICAWESGRVMPRAMRLDGLARALGVSVDYMLKGREAGAARPSPGMERP